MQLLQAGGQRVELLHPALVGLVAGREDRFEVRALLPRPAALAIGRIAEVGGDRHQAALAGVLDRDAVDGLALEPGLSRLKSA